MLISNFGNEDDDTTQEHVLVAVVDFFLIDF